MRGYTETTLVPRARITGAVHDGRRAIKTLELRRTKAIQSAGFVFLRVEVEGSGVMGEGWKVMARVMGGSGKQRSDLCF